MITENNKRDLRIILGNLSKRDMVQGDKQHRLSKETLKACDVYGMAYKINPTKEDEEQVKDYLSKVIFAYPDLLSKK
jgi:hypothetical protein